MTSFTKTGCALIDSDDGNCQLAEASITPGGLYSITKAVRRAILAAHRSLYHSGIIVFEGYGTALKGYADSWARTSWSRWF
jgi:hypothetical protein